MEISSAKAFWSPRFVDGICGSSACCSQVLGHSKTVGVLALGFMLFGAPVTLRNLCG
jgi:hypothetical protein